MIQPRVRKLVAMPQPLYDRMSRLAAEADLSDGMWIIAAIEHYVEYQFEVEQRRARLNGSGGVSQPGVSTQVLGGAPRPRDACVPGTISGLR